MATRLHAFATAIHAALTAAGVTNVEMRVGRNEFSFHGAKRRICWIEPGGKLTPPLQAGGRQVSTDRSPACKVREAEVRIYVFGGDATATEDLFEALVTAICNNGEARAEMPRYRWVTEEEQHGGNVNRTECVELTATLRLPVLSEIKPLRNIVSVDDVCGTIGGTETNWTVIPHG